MIALFATRFNTTVLLIGALVFALISVVGSAMFRAQGAADGSATAIVAAANSFRKRILLCEPD